MPSAFEAVLIGWRVKLTAKPYGKMVVICGVAEFTDVKLVPGGYGALAGPIVTEKGEVLTPNKLDQPRTQTTVTRSQVFAIPGESYDVRFYRGDKIEKHRLTIKAAP